MTASTLRGALPVQDVTETRLSVTEAFIKDVAVATTKRQVTVKYRDECGDILGARCVACE